MRNIENQNTVNSSKRWVARWKYNRLSNKTPQEKRTVFTCTTCEAQTFERNYGIYLSEPDGWMA